MATLLADQTLGPYSITRLTSLLDGTTPILPLESRRRKCPPVGLYIHIPFCKSKCHYCDFSAFAGKEGVMAPYMSALEKEMERLSEFSISSVFIGGGTPTFLGESVLKRLLALIQNHFHVNPGAEFTVESNPETFTRQKADVLQEGGVNRLSFGLQTTDDGLLMQIGRIHNVETFYRSYELARDAGFSNINVDLIYGLPQQSLSQWQATVDEIASLGPEHISAYGLTVEGGTVMKQKGVTVDEDLEAEMYTWVHKRLLRQGYEHYEISNFSKPDRECRHNCLYWEDGDFLGLGCSAASSYGGHRWQNDPHLEGYIHKMKALGDSTVYRERLTGDNKLAERLILKFRLARGISLSRLGGERFDRVFREFEACGFLRENGDRLEPTLRGWLLSNQLFVNLMLAAEEPPCPA